jgi:transketolase
MPCRKYILKDRIALHRARPISFVKATMIAIIATGETVYHALEAARMLEQENISALVLDMPTIKPIDREAILMAAETTGRIITVEEHSIYGGLGSAVAEIVSQECPVRMKIMGFPDEDLIHATPQELYEYYGLTREGICREVKKLLVSRQAKKWREVL